MTSGVLLMTAYFVLFGIIHSLLADLRVKRSVKQALGQETDRWYRLAYVILAIAAILPFIYILVLIPDQTLYVAPAPWSWLMVAGQALATLAVVAALRQTGFLYFFGLSQLLSAAPKEPGALITSGFYCYTRNPLFFFGAVFLWLFPIMTVNLLAFNILATMYFYFGALHEERSLQAEFGEAYEKYRRKVPMFIPRIRC